MKEYNLNARDFRESGYRRMTDRRKREVIRFLWFVISIAIVVQIAMIDGVDKPFY